jgi:hypothetical protein
MKLTEWRLIRYQSRSGEHEDLVVVEHKFIYFVLSYLMTAVHPEYQYLDLLKDILDRGTRKELFLTPEVQQQYIDRSEEMPYITSIFGAMMRFDLRK